MIESSESQVSVFVLTPVVCGTPASYVDQTVNYTDNTGDSLARYACKSDYSSSNNTFARCDAFAGRWTTSPLHCYSTSHA